MSLIFEKLSVRNIYREIKIGIKLMTTPVTEAVIANAFGILTKTLAKLNSDMRKIKTAENPIISNS